MTSFLQAVMAGAICAALCDLLRSGIASHYRARSQGRRMLRFIARTERALAISGNPSDANRARRWGWRGGQRRARNRSTRDPGLPHSGRAVSSRNLAARDKQRDAVAMPGRKPDPMIPGP